MTAIPHSTAPSAQTPKAGDVFHIPFPFVRVTVQLLDEDEDGRGCIDVPSWKPGAEFYEEGSRGPWSRDAYEADGLGCMELTVVSVHRPGLFPTRVFFTRQFITPDGKRFGKGGLRIRSVGKFRQIATRYQHPFSIRKSPPANTETVK